MITSSSDQTLEYVNCLSLGLHLCKGFKYILGRLLIEGVYLREIPRGVYNQTRRKSVSKQAIAVLIEIPFAFQYWFLIKHQKVMINRIHSNTFEGGLYPRELTIE